jgi:hypothetical protein
MRRTNVLVASFHLAVLCSIIVSLTPFFVEEAYADWCHTNPTNCPLPGHETWKQVSFSFPRCCCLDDRHALYCEGDPS